MLVATMQTAAYHAAIERYQINGFPVWRFLPTNGAAQAQADAPHVFVIHGLNSRKERYLDFCLELVQQGLCAVSLDLRSHGVRADGNTAALQQEVNSLPFLLAFASVVDGTIADIRAVADDFGLTSYGLWGHSMGGYLVTRAALDDERASVVVNLSGSIDVASFGLPDVPPLGDMVRRADIIARAPGLAPRPYLMLHGALDDIIPASGARRLHPVLSAAYASQGASDHLRYIEYPAIGHEFTPEIRAESLQFLRRHLRKGSE